RCTLSRTSGGARARCLVGDRRAGRVGLAYPCLLLLRLPATHQRRASSVPYPARHERRDAGRVRITLSRGRRAQGPGRHPRCGTARRRRPRADQALRRDLPRHGRRRPRPFRAASAARRVHAGDRRSLGLCTWSRGVTSQGLVDTHAHLMDPAFDADRDEVLARARDAVVHDRAPEEAASALAAEHTAGGVLHCFSSDDPHYLERMLELGYFVSFAGTLTFKNATALRSMAARVPLERLLVETDCPYLAP